MMMKKQILDTLLGKQIVDALIETLYVQTDDFPEIHQAYLEAIEKLEAGLGEKDKIQKYVAAIEQQCASNLFFAGVQGLKMNLEHFRNPTTPNCTWEQIAVHNCLPNPPFLHKGDLSSEAGTWFHSTERSKNAR